jgi:hypothetical protein
MHNCHKSRVFPRAFSLVCSKLLTVNATTVRCTITDQIQTEPPPLPLVQSNRNHHNNLKPIWYTVQYVPVAVRAGRGRAAGERRGSRAVPEWQVTSMSVVTVPVGGNTRGHDGRCQCAMDSLPPIWLRYARRPWPTNPHGNTRVPNTRSLTLSPVHEASARAGCSPHTRHAKRS